MCVSISPERVEQFGLSADLLSKIAIALKPLEPTRACIFGSAVIQGLNARDIDLLVLSTQFDGVRFYSREELVNLPDGPYFDMWLYTPDEFEMLCPRGHSFRESVEAKNIDILPFVGGK